MIIKRPKRMFVQKRQHDEPHEKQVASQWSRQCDNSAIELNRTLQKRPERYVKVETISHQKNESACDFAGNIALTAQAYSSIYQDVRECVAQIQTLRQSHWHSLGWTR